MTRLFVVVLLAIALERVSGQSAADSVCSIVPSSLKLANPEDCKTYYECVDGTATLKKCAATEIYSKNSEKCVTSSQTTCNVISSANACVGAPVDSFVNNPSSCGAYYYCDSNSKANAGDCPPGLNFNPSDSSCDYPSVYQCSNTPGTSIVGNYCLYVPSNKYFGDPESCSTWHLCTTDDVMETGTCPGELVFNLLSQSCDYKSKTDCAQLSGANSNGGPCTTPGNKEAAGPYAACNQYYECIDTTNVLKVCPINQSFDSTLGCVPTAKANNQDCNRCADWTGTFVSAASTTGCTSYLICTNGKVTGGPTACPKGLYFNQVQGGCVSTDPAYPWCEGTAATGDSGESAEPPETPE